LIALLLADKGKASNINFQANTGTFLFPFQHFAEKINRNKNSYKNKIGLFVYHTLLLIFC
jgi:hypothetical protein